MGSFFTDVLSFDHECAVYEIDPRRMRFLYNTQRFTTLDEIRNFQPELVINAVTLKYTIDVFEQVIPCLPKDCIISDISSVKTGLKDFYEHSGMRYVSTHPMFGPTFANLGALSSENAIVINEGDYMGRIRGFLQDRVDKAMDAGIPPDDIILDPGIGFGKTVEQNLEILRNPLYFSKDYPVLTASSRKRFLKEVYLGIDPDEASALAALESVNAGASMVRVHDVARTVDRIRGSKRLR